MSKGKILRYFDYENNEPIFDKKHSIFLKIEELSIHSHRELNWKCDKCGNKWKAKVFQIAFSKINPCVRCRSFATIYPNLLKEWDYTKNEIDPFSLSPYNTKLVFWHCKTCNKKWKASVENSLKGKLKKCKCHISLGNRNPELAKEWHPTKNGDLTPFNVAEYKREKFWWKCQKCGYEWKESLMGRSRGWKSGWNQCFRCKSFGNVYLEMTKFWHPIKNGKLTPYDFLSRANNKFWWSHFQDGEEHVWKASIDSMANSSEKKSNGCPYCHGLKVCKGNSLSVNYPNLSKEWNLEKNGKLTPDKVTYGSSDKVWWKCSKCNNEWNAQITHRTYCGTGCPKCSIRNKVILKDGTCCASKVEALFYLKYKEEELEFLHNEKYGSLGKRGFYRYDFYFPKTNTYVEVTGFNEKNEFHGIWDKYIERIQRKREYVENTLNGKFIFISHAITSDEKEYVKKHTKST